MKKTVRLLAILFVLFSIVGCTNSKTDENENSQVSLADVFTKVKEQIAADMKAGGVEDAYLDEKLQGYLEVDLKKEDSNDPAHNIFKEKLSINDADIDEGFVLAPMMNTKSDEVILLKAKDEKKVETLKKALEKEKEAQIQTWERYLPDQYEKVKNNKIVTKGNYLLYVTYDHPEKIVDIFESSIK